MADIIIYNTADGKAEIKLYADNGTVWLTQAQIAELFTKNISTISRHIANIFDENEIEEKAICVLCKLQIQTSRWLFIVLMSFLPSVSASVRHAARSSASGKLKA